jgi:hypothetical protein
VARAAPPSVTISDVDFLELALEDAQERQAREEGVAGVQAAKLVLHIKAQLDAARAAQKRDSATDLAELPEAQLVERLEAAGDEMPLPHLEVLVRKYCERTGAQVIAVHEGG